MRVPIKELANLEKRFAVNDFVTAVVAKEREGDRNSCIVRDDSGSIPVVMSNEGACVGRLTRGTVVKLDGLSLRRRDLAGGNSSAVFRIELVCDRVTRLSAVANQMTIRGAENLAARARIVAMSSLADFSQSRQIVSLLGVVKRIFPAATVKTKRDGVDLRKVSFVLVDPSGSVIATLWGAEAALAETFVEGKTVLLLEDAVVTEWKGKFQASVSVDTIVTVNPSTFPAARDIVSRCESAGLLGGISANPDEIVDTYEISKIEGLLEQVTGPTTCVFGKCIGSLTYIGLFRCCCFKSCPTCRRRCEEGSFFCHKCQKEVSPDLVLCIRVALMDHGGQLSATLFGRVAEEFLGIQALEVSSMPQETKEQLVSSIMWKRFVLSFRVCDSKLRVICLKPL